MYLLLDQTAQPIHRVPDVNEARVERRKSKPNDVRLAEVDDHPGPLDERPADRPGFAMAQGYVRPAFHGLARRGELEAERGEPGVMESDGEVG